jgi:hypothetical protein
MRKYEIRIYMTTDERPSEREIAWAIFNHPPFKDVKLQVPVVKEIKHSDATGVTPILKRLRDNP